MKTYLVTGAAGFIGANYLKCILKKYEGKEDIKVIVVDSDLCGKFGNNKRRVGR